MASALARACSTLRRLEVAVVALALSAGVFALLAFGRRRRGAAIAAVASARRSARSAEFVVSRRVRAWGYAEREDDLLVRRGVLFSRLSVIPYGRMQFIDVTAGPVERRSGSRPCACTPPPPRATRAFPGLAADEASRVRDRLAELGEAQAAGL